MKQLFYLFYLLTVLAFLLPSGMKATASYPVSILPTVADTIKAIRIEQPKDAVITGKEQIITWIANFTDTVRIELYKNELLYATLEYRTLSRPGANSFIWNVPANFPKGGGYRLIIRSVNDADISGKSNLLTFKSDSKNSRKFIWIAGGLIAAAGLTFLGIQLAKPKTSALPEPPLPDGQ